jgi:hypothetical protein
MAVWTRDTVAVVRKRWTLSAPAHVTDVGSRTWTAPYDLGVLGTMARRHWSKWHQG